MNMDMNQDNVFRFTSPIGPNGGKVEAIGPGGKRYELTLTPSDVHTTEELSTFLAGYRPFAFRADEVSPIIPVDASKFFYRTFGADDAFLHVNTRVGLTSPPVNIDPSSSTETGYTENHSVGSLVPVQTEKQAGQFSPRAKAGKRCMNAILLDREKEVMDLVGTNTSWDVAVRHTVGATENWDGGVDSDPIKKLQEALQASLQEVVGILFNRKVSDAFLRHDKTRDHMRQMLGDTAANNITGRLSDYVIPGFPPFKVVQGKIRTTPGGTTSYILGNHVVLLCRPDDVPDDGEEIASTYTFRERGTDGVGINVREWFVEGAGTEGAYMINVTMAERPYMTGNACGGHIASVVS